jgi:hypothetical protein
MATATIVKAWKDQTYAYVAASVGGDDPSGPVEYIAKTPLVDSNNNPYTAAQLKANLTAALSTVRNAALAQTTNLPTISGTVTV